jgi:hypothetical protein
MKVSLLNLGLLRNTMMQRVALILKANFLVLLSWSSLLLLHSIFFEPHLY